MTTPTIRVESEQRNTSVKRIPSTDHRSGHPPSTFLGETTLDKLDVLKERKSLFTPSKWSLKCQ